MATNREITVAVWIEPPRPIVSARRVRMRFLPSAVIGFSGTLLLHLLAFQAVFFGSRAHKTLPEVQQPGSLSNQFDPKADGSLVLIDLPRTSGSNNTIGEAIASMRAAIKINPILVRPSPPQLEILSLSNESSESTASAGDGVELARLFGIYTAQILARVERVWKRPRTIVSETKKNQVPTDADQSFQCQVQVVQDAIGNVQEILLPRCNGTSPWQRSLVVAIQQASPLPAPPSSSVFSRSITLNFAGLAYVAGGPDEDYEPVPRKVQAVSAFPMRQTTQVMEDDSHNLPPRPQPDSNSDIEQTSN